jgi:hypothetical protein
MALLNDVLGWPPLDWLSHDVRDERKAIRKEGERRESERWNRSVDALLVELRERQRMISVEGRQRSFHGIDLSSRARERDEWVITELDDSSRAAVQDAYRQIHNLQAERRERESSVESQEQFWDERWLALSEEEVAHRETALKSIARAIAVLVAARKNPD